MDVSKLVELRNREKGKLKERGIKLTFLPFIIKAVIKGLQKFPNLNAELNGKKIIVKNYYNIGIAAGTEHGLMVPNVKDADQKSIVQLAQEITELIGRAQERKLTLDEMAKGTFTVSSIGSIGGQMFTPILNTPEAGILGIGRIVEKPIAKNGGINIAQMMWLSFSFDHRVVDGDYAARFVNEVKTYLEDPDLLLMEV